jgi:hypothetical protein
MRRPFNKTKATGWFGMPFTELAVEKNREADFPVPRLQSRHFPA